jgi:antitoxin YefM
MNLGNSLLKMYSIPVQRKGMSMAIQTTYTKARANLAELLNKVTANRELVIIQRRGAEDVALIAAAELEGLLETAHLLRSPKNAERLLTALARAQARTVAPQSIEELRREVKLGPVE